MEIHILPLWKHLSEFYPSYITFAEDPEIQQIESRFTIYYKNTNIGIVWKITP